MDTTNGRRESNSEQVLHIAMLPWFAFGHINPFIELSNKLTSHNIKVTFFSIPGNIPRIKSSLNLSPPNQLIPLPLPPIPGLHPNVDSSSEMTLEVGSLLMVALDQMQPLIKTLLSQLKPNFIFFDFAHHWLPPLASQLGIKSVYFSVFSAIATSYLTVPSRITNPTIDDMKKPPLGFPETSMIMSTIKTFEARDFLYIFKKSFNGGLSVFERLRGMLQTCDVLLYKSCLEIEGQYIEHIKAQCEIPVLLAGPVVPGPPSAGRVVLEEKWANWLSQFEERSVIFCNFGSETYLNRDQIQELTLGLEITKMPFFLVLNFGTGGGGDDAEDKLEKALPEGFRERVKERGVVHTGWVQQQQIMAHKSVGCYVCHSGFSSVVEGIVNDCQLVLVPQKGDQFMNSKLLSRDLGVAVEVNRRDEDGHFRKEDVFEAVRMVMGEETDNEPGKTIRANQKKWKKFLLDKQIQEKYLADLVQQLNTLATKV